MELVRIALKADHDCSQIVETFAHQHLFDYRIDAIARKPMKILRSYIGPENRFENIFVI